MNYKISNEELAVLIKNGDDGYMPQLWEQVRRIITSKAYKIWNSMGNKRGLEAEDLVQQGYFAVVEAVRYYDPGKDFKFTTYLGNTLKRAFASAMGKHQNDGTRRCDLLDTTLSLDAPMDGKDGEFTLLEVVSANMEDESLSIDSVVKSIHNRDLHKALDEAMKILSEEQRRSIYLYYYFNIPQPEIATIEGTTRQNVSAQIQENLSRIRYSRHGKILREFLPCSEIGLYNGTGCFAWKNGGSVEERFLIQKEG